MTAETGDHRAERERALAAFRETCERFVEIAQASARSSPVRGALYGARSGFFAYFVRHPLRATRDLGHAVVAYPTALNAVDQRFPVDDLLAYLERYGAHELQGLKALTALNLRTHRERLVDNPVFKLSIPVGALFVVLQLGREWSQSRLGATLAGFAGTTAASWVFMTVVGGLLLTILQGVFVIVPGILRAQLLDDLVLIAIEDRRVRASRLQSADSGVTGSPIIAR